MGVFTQVARNIKGFARKFTCKSAYASCVNRAQRNQILHQNTEWKYSASHTLSLPLSRVWIPVWKKTWGACLLWKRKDTAVQRGSKKGSSFTSTENQGAQMDHKSGQGGSGVLKVFAEQARMYTLQSWNAAWTDHEHLVGTNQLFSWQDPSVKGGQAENHRPKKDKLPFSPRT